MFRTDWITLCTPDRPFAIGETLVLHVRHLGFHSVIANRVVYTIEEPARMVFGCGTLTGHAEQSEERFQVVMDDAGTVSFVLFAFPGPRHPLARLGTRTMRVLQRQAAAAYSGAMQRAVTDWAGAPGFR